MESQKSLRFCFPPWYGGENAPHWSHVSSSANEHDNHRLHDDILQVSHSLLFLSYLKVISISPPFIPVFTFCFSVSDQLQLFSFGSGSISPLMQLSTTQIEAEALQLLLSMLSYSISRSWYFCHHIVCIYLLFLTGKVECLMLWQQVELWLLHLDWTAWQRFV